MNFLENRELMKTLLLQGDQMHTISGGVISPQINVKQADNKIEIYIKAASLREDNYAIDLNMNQLVVSAYTSHSSEQAFPIPLFSRIFQVPSVVDIDEIEAFYRDDVLVITMPLNGDIRDVHRSIEIKHL